LTLLIRILPPSSLDSTAVTATTALLLAEQTEDVGGFIVVMSGRAGHIYVDQLVEVISGDVLQGYEIHTYWRCWREY